MPIYEYHCLDCSHKFELMQRFSDPPAHACPACTGRVEKLISRSAFHLKGNGWYTTDYAGKRHNGSNDTEHAAKDSSVAGSDTTSAASTAADSDAAAKPAGASAS